uniref:Uncharacterized protein n=1 Tax=Penaeus semisulcatus majanivirus TaxID=2984274 RepID=A0A9C7C5V3_9VIRU|nr:MAG: hypothetical protein [Penaeus semisulcatus majanivirus]
MEPNKGENIRGLLSSVTLVASALYRRRTSSKAGSPHKLLTPPKPLTKFILDGTATSDGSMSTEQNQKSPVGEGRPGGTKRTSIRPDVTIRSVSSAEPDRSIDSHHTSSQSECETTHPLGRINSPTDADDSERESKSNNSPTDSLCLSKEIEETLTGIENRVETDRGGRAEFEADRRVRSRRTFVPGPDQLNGLAELTFDGIRISEDDDHETNHPLEMANSVTRVETDRGGRAEFEADRRVRSRRTFVPGPDQLNGLAELTFDGIRILEDDDHETNHPLEMANSVTRVETDRGGRAEFEADRRVRSRRTFVPGPDQLNGLAELTFDGIRILEDDDHETNHPLANSVTRGIVDG